MFRFAVRTLTLALATAYRSLHAADGVVVIGHPSLRRLDPGTVERIYTGKQVQVDDIFVTAVNADIGSGVRERFLMHYLKQDEGRYTGYWRVRRSIGQGKPPKELTKSIDVINFVNSTPGGIGYIKEEELQPGLNVLLKN